jgi:predicted transcriptional regulator
MEHHVSDAEWTVMRVLWGCKGSMTSAEVVAAVNDGRSPQTIKTLLQRLVAKSFVAYTVDVADSRVYHYSAAKSEEECVQLENKRFMELYYRGSASRLIASFMKEAELSDEEIERFQTALNEMKGKK